MGNWQETSQFLAGRGGTSTQGFCCSPSAVDRDRVDYKGYHIGTLSPRLFERRVETLLMISLGRLSYVKPLFKPSLCANLHQLPIVLL